MELVHTGERMPVRVTRSIFLAGPTPRSRDVASWRPEALRLLKERGFDGTVFVPEHRPDTNKLDYEYGPTIDWEHAALDRADCILFWVPRDLKTLPAFTTNVEYGLHAASGKIVFGAPANAPKNGYLRYIAPKFVIPTTDSLEQAIDLALARIGQGAVRENGECEVPLLIWKEPSFQSWYQAQKMAGNRLDGARVRCLIPYGKSRVEIFLWIVHVKVWITSESRHKTNEVVVGRPDISSVVLCYLSPDPSIVLVREFRSPAATSDGFIWELPSGSSLANGKTAEQIAIDEVQEETGFIMKPGRLRRIGSRQAAGTLASHRIHLFAYFLKWDELKWFTEREGERRGLQNVPTGEQTYIHVRSLSRIRSDGLVDWSTLGMISAALP